MSGFPSNNLFTEITVPNEECDAVNSSIKESKYAVLYGHMNDAVKQAMGPTFQLNWRWFDPNLFLHELGIQPFGSENKKNDLNVVVRKYLSLTASEKINILNKSVIEPLDAFLAAKKQDAGMKKESKGQLKAAIEDYEDALQLDPHCQSSLYNYADLMIKEKQFDKAEKQLQPLLLLNCKNAMAWGLLAIIYEHKKNFNAAVNCYEKAYANDRTSTTRLRNYALLLMEMKRLERAKSLFEEIIVLAPSDGVLIGEYADLLHTMGLLTESVAAFEQAIATGNTNNTVINDYAVLLQKVAMMNKDEKSKTLMQSIQTSSLSAMMNNCVIRNSALICDVCQAEGKFVCSKCKLVRYCSRTCQVNAWPQHKTLCKSVSKNL